MNENSVCPIWGTTAVVESTGPRDGKYVDSPRAGGRYFISSGAETTLKHKQDELERTGSIKDGWDHAGGKPSEVERLKARLTSWLVKERRLGVECPEITGYPIAEVEQRQHLPVHERADRLLQYIETETSRIGESLAFHVRLEKALYPAEMMLDTGEKIDDIDAHISESHQNNWKMMAWSECTKSNSFDEAEFLLKYLQEKDWIEYDSSNASCALTVEGYARIAELEKVATDSSQAFVAMWFDDSMNDTYENGIKPGIEDAGYNPLPINKKEHINKIDDEIIAEIRRSRFVVADFTHGDSGARGGVYYEAGFAHGQDIPVIFTCREDILEDIHFDTRQYNHIPWVEDKLEEFRKALSDRISAVIGDGPKKEKDYEQDA